MKKFSIVSYAALLIVLAGVAAHYSIARAADATASGCPQGYTCVPVPRVANCPPGNICSRVDGVPALSLLTPIGGDNITAGQTIRTLAWISHNLPAWATLAHFRILLIGATSTIALSPTADQRFQGGFDGYLTQNGISYANEVKVPASVTPGPYLVAVSCPSCGRGAESLSLSSIIVHATSTAPSISVLSPAANQIHMAGQPVFLTWSSKNIPSSQNVMIGMYSVSDQTKAYIVNPDGVRNTGAYLWSIPSDASGPYSIQISCKDCLDNNGTVTYGWGSTFTVKQQPSKLTAISGPGGGSVAAPLSVSTPTTVMSTPTPSPSPSASPQPTDSPTPSPVPSFTPTATVTAPTVPAPSPKMTPSPTPEPSNSPTPTPTP